MLIADIDIYRCICCYSKGILFSGTCLRLPASPRPPFLMSRTRSLRRSSQFSLPLLPFALLSPLPHSLTHFLIAVSSPSHLLLLSHPSLSPPLFSPSPFPTHFVPSSLSFSSSTSRSLTPLPPHLSLTPPYIESHYIKSSLYKRPAIWNPLYRGYP